MYILALNEDDNINYYDLYLDNDSYFLDYFSFLDNDGNKIVSLSALYEFNKDKKISIDFINSFMKNSFLSKIDYDNNTNYEFGKSNSIILELCDVDYKNNIISNEQLNTIKDFNEVKEDILALTKKRR